MDPTATVYQILCKFRIKWDGDPGNDWAAVGDDSIKRAWVWNGKVRNDHDQKWRHWLKAKSISMLVIFFDIEGTFSKEFAIAGQTVNFCDVLLRLRENVRRIRLNFGDKGAWLLQTAHRLTSF
jgi:hypothetical protein